MSNPYIGTERQAKNDMSRNAADHHAEPWLDYEVDVLLEWDQTEETLDDLAEVLGRTREACRQRFYQTLKGAVGTGRTVRVTVTTTTTTTTTQTETYAVCPACHFELPASGTCGICE